MTSGKWFAALLTGALLAPPALAATVVVRIHDVANAKGRVMVALCTETEFMKRCAKSLAVPAAAGDVSVTFSDVAPGQYAGMVFHDENGDGKLNRSDIGIPTEGAAFSRNAMGQQGPPVFADAAFQVKDGQMTIDINLVYY